jgi:diguanylate cyclase (GGDEF)-like protein/PAS domain S-box-containing protein
MSSAIAVSQARRVWMPAVSLLVVAIVVGIGWLQYKQWSRFEATISQSRAGVEWDLFQLQAERYKMLAKLNEALLTRGDPAVMEDVVLRHEVLISRLEIMRAGSGPREAFRAPENRPLFDRMEAYALAGDAYFGRSGDAPAYAEVRLRALRDALVDMASSMQDLVITINTIHNDQARARGEQLRKQAVVSGLTSLALAVLVGVMGLLALRQLIQVRQNNAELMAVRDQLQQALARAEISNEALSASEQRLTGLIDTAKDAIVSIDQSQHIVVFNSAAEAMFGRTAREMMGRSLEVLLPQDVRPRHHEFVARFGQIGSMPRSMGPIAGLKALRANGEVFPIEASISTFDASGQITYLVIIRDITERERDYRALRDSENSLREAQGRVQQLAYFDSLTQIPNRVRYIDEVATLLRTTMEQASVGAALLIDLDNFKSINDNWGHRCGDKLLVEMARRIVDSVPVGSFVARLGGDEFIVLLTGLSSGATTATARVREVCRTLLAALSASYSLDDREHVCSASIGVALFGNAPMDADDLLSRADSAMYQAKADGRNDFRFFDQQLQDRLAGIAELEADLRLSIAATNCNCTTSRRSTAPAR